MTLKNIFWILVLLFALPVAAFPETINSVYVDGKAPIVIDGDLSDWGWLELTPVKIENLVRKYLPKPWEPKSENDFSASFECFRDDANIYAAFMVTDDTLVLGQERYGQCFRDDAVEIILFGKQAIFPVTGRADVARLFISAHSNGKTKVEGREPQSLVMGYPALRKKWGINAALHKNEKGYNVEIAIPLATLREWAEWEIGQPLKLNIRAYDDDTFEEVNQTYLEWAENIFEWPPNEKYNRHAPDKNYNEVIFIDNVSSIKPMDKSGTAVSNMEVVVTEPNQTGDSYDPSYQLSYGIALEKTGFYNEAIETFEKIVIDGNDNQIMQQAKLELAKSYFYIGNYTQAKLLAEEIINSNVNSKTELDARMILLSIESKNNE